VRRTAQLVTLLALTSPGVALLGPAATASQAAGLIKTKPAVLQAGWFWQTAYEQANPPIGEAPPPVTEPSGVPEGDLAVAATSNDGSSSKSTALAFTIGKAAKTGSTISTFTFSLKLDDSPSAANVNAAEAPVVACLATRGWSQVDGGDYSDAPVVNCDLKVKPTIKDGTFTFEVPAIAQKWVGDANFGVALVNDPDNTQPFQAVFSGPKTIDAVMAFLPPAPALPADDGTSGTATGTGGTPTTGGGSTDTGGSIAPPPSTPVDLPPAAQSDSPPDAGQDPQVADGSAAAAAAPVAVAKAAPSMPGAPFWIGALALALLIVTASVVLGDPAVPVPAANTSRLGRVLRERELERQALAQENDPAPTLTPRRV
jgi:hypothetical protein